MAFMSGAPDLSIIVMAYNEDASLEQVVREADEGARSLAISREIIIVDDGSHDTTGVIAERLAKDLSGCRVVSHPQNRGLGSVYWTGLEEGRGEWIIFISADRQFLPMEVLPLFWRAATKADVVVSWIGSQHRGVAGAFLSWAERVLYRLLFGPMPRFQGMIMVRRAVVEETALTSRGGCGWGIAMEIVVRAVRMGLRVASVPIPYHPRNHGRSRAVHIRSVIANLAQAFALWSALRRT